MPHKVIVTAEAERNLEAIGDYIALDNPAAAEETVDRILSYIESLTELPKRYRIREDLGRDRRVLVVGNYLVVYRIDGNSVYIERISEGSRDLQQLSTRIIHPRPDDSAQSRLRPTTAAMGVQRGNFISCSSSRNSAPSPW